jgi:hypothetical protein
MTDRPIATTHHQARPRKSTLLAAAPALAETALDRRVRLLEQEPSAIKSGARSTQREAALERRVIELENELKGVRGNVEAVQKPVGSRVVRVPCHKTVMQA